MAKQREWQSDCKINLPDGTSCKGAATVMEVSFDGDFTGWLARVKLAVALDQARLTGVQAANDGVGVVFDNGKSGHAKLAKKVLSDAGAFIYFVGITDLNKP